MKGYGEEQCITECMAYMTSILSIIEFVQPLHLSWEKFTFRRRIMKKQRSLNNITKLFNTTVEKSVKFGKN